MDTKKNTNGGFLQFIVLLIIVLVILIYFGFDLNTIYTKYVLPAVLVGWEVIKIVFGGIIEIAKFFVYLLKGGWQGLMNALSLIKK